MNTVMLEFPIEGRDDSRRSGMRIRGCTLRFDPMKIQTSRCNNPDWTTIYSQMDGA